MIKKPELSDRELLESYKNGDEMSFRVFYLRYNKRIMSYVYRIVKDHDAAQDICQDVFLKFISVIKNGEYFENEKSKSYLFTMAHNLCINRVRSANHKRNLSLNPKSQSSTNFTIQIADHSLNIEEMIIDSELNERLTKVINSLSPKQKELFLLRFNGLLYREIAEYLDIPIGTVKSSLMFTLLNIKEMYRNPTLE